MGISIISPPSIDTLQLTSYQVVPASKKISIWYSVGYMKLVDDPASTPEVPLPQIEVFESVRSEQYHILDVKYDNFIAALSGGLQSDMLPKLYDEVVAIL